MIEYMDMETAWKFGYALGLLRGISKNPGVPSDIRDMLFNVLPKLEESNETVSGQK